MNQEEPEVARYEFRTLYGGLASVALDGIRQDTIQYMPRKFHSRSFQCVASAVSQDWMVASFERRRGPNCILHSEAERVGMASIQNSIPILISLSGRSRLMCYR